MSSFLGSPASVSILVDTPQSGQAPLGHAQLYANTPCDLLDMDQQSSPRIAGAKSPRRYGKGVPFQNRARKVPIADSALQETAADLKGGHVTQSSARQSDQADDIDSRPGPHERSSLDGGSLDQRSLAMSTEFFDAEEALECERAGFLSLSCLVLYTAFLLEDFDSRFSFYQRVICAVQCA
jgi:hypothetical protein